MALSVPEPVIVEVEDVDEDEEASNLFLTSLIWTSRLDEVDWLAVDIRLKIPTSNTEKQPVYISNLLVWLSKHARI